MKKIFTSIILVLVFINVHAQKSVLTGKVLDNKNRPIKGANVSIANSYDGSTTDSNGAFRFTTKDTGSKFIQAGYTGFSTMQKPIILNGTAQEFIFNIKEKINELKAVSITAGAFEASDEKKGTVLKPLDIVTTAGSNGDNFAALKTLPGTQQNNDKEGLFVRGGTGGETQTFIDGTLVRNAFLTGVPDLGSRGRFNPFLFKGTTFSAGGYSALYGQALSSAVILETEDMPEKSQGFANLSSVGVGLGILKLNKKKNASASITYSHTNLGPYFYLVKQNVHYNLAPVFNQIDISARKQLSKTGIIKMYAYVNLRNLDISRNDINSYDNTADTFKYLNGFKLKGDNVYLNLSYKDYIAANTKLFIGFSTSHNLDKFGFSSLYKNNTLNLDTSYHYKNNGDVKNINSMTTAKFYIQQNLANANKLRVGSELIYYNDGNEYGVAGNVYNTKMSDYYAAVFAEGDIYITNNLAGKIGLRSEYSSILNKANLAPRVSLAYKLDANSAMSFAYGEFYQKPETQYLFNSPGLKFMRASHLIANYTYQKPGYYLRAEIFNKQYHNLIKTDYSANLFVPINANNNGTGYARGLEIYYRDQKTIKGIDYWISYSYIDTRRNFLNYLQSTQPDFVASHVASLVFKKFWVKKMFGINGTYTYSTGRPYVNFNTYNPSSTSNNPDLFMADYAPAYHNFSVSCNYLKPIGKTFNVFVFSINNPFYIKQVYGYNYSRVAKNQDGSFYRQAVIPAAPAFFFIGVFSSWGTDKSQDAINNNL
jgi:vitamin B12 transporter